MNFAVLGRETLFAWNLRNYTENKKCLLLLHVHPQFIMRRRNGSLTECQWRLLAEFENFPCLFVSMVFVSPAYFREIVFFDKIKLFRKTKGCFLSSQINLKRIVKLLKDPPLRLQPYSKPRWYSEIFLLASTNTQNDESFSPYLSRVFEYFRSNFIATCLPSLLCFVS